MAAGHYIGLMSGTSMDGVDAALVYCDSSSVTLKGSYFLPLPASLQTNLKQLITTPTLSLQQFGELNVAVAEQYLLAVQALLKQQSITPSDVIAIGAHGQTIFHQPPDRNHSLSFSLQLLEPNYLAKHSGIDVVCDFRQADIVLGGQGAPLAPVFHAFAFGQERNTAVLNLGGIANITLLDKAPIQAFDTGPASILMDSWILQHQGKLYDENGTWAQSGTIDLALLTRLMAHPYLLQTPPKSTGFETFNSDWLATQLSQETAIAPVDVQATLLEFTARSITDQLKKHFSGDTLLVCGGGVHNSALMQRLRELSGLKVESTASQAIDPDWVEAMAFAWFAYKNKSGEAANAPSVTGASRPTVLGGYYSHR